MIIATINNTSESRYLDRGNWGLTDESTITIDGQTYPIPERLDGSGIFAPPRLGQAIRDAGYRPTPDCYAALDAGGPCTIAVEPL